MRNTEHLKNLLDRIVSQGAPGNGLIVYVNGEKQFEYCSGYADLESGVPMTPDTVFRAYSMTKVVVCTAALLLYERGFFQLNEPIASFLPIFSKPDVLSIDGRGVVNIAPAKNPILIRHLFSMTSGITGKGFAPTTIPGKLYQKEFDKIYEKTRDDYTIGDLVESIAHTPLAFEPGTHWHYGSSHEVLGRLIEILTGKTMGQFLHDEIFEPLGMHHTAFSMEEHILQHDLCKFYRLQENGQAVSDSSKDTFYHANARFEAAGGGLLTTLNDFSKFAQALACGHYNGVTILNRRTIDLMRINQLSGQPLYDFQQLYLDGSYARGYGYGLGVRTLIDKAAAGSNGSVGEFGWYGMAGPLLLADAAEGMSAVYLHQSVPYQASNLHWRLRNAIYASLE